MNFLAHLYLSGSDSQIMTGNFIADHVKGKAWQKYPEGIQKGIFIHRDIDSTTDKHPLVKQGANRLRKHFRLYSGIFIDFFYDHFLAANWEQFNPDSLQKFARNAHRTLLANFFHLPIGVQSFLPFLIGHNRLVSYGKIEGIEESIEIMSRHTSLPDNTYRAIEILKRDYDSYEKEFMEFMDEMIPYLEEKYDLKIRM